MRAQIRSDLSERVDEQAASVVVAIKQIQVVLQEHGIEFVDVLMAPMFRADQGGRAVRLGFVNKDNPWQPTIVEDCVLRVAWEKAQEGYSVTLDLEERDAEG